MLLKDLLTYLLTYLRTNLNLGNINTAIIVNNTYTFAKNGRYYVTLLLNFELPYILAYKSPPKNRVRMWSKLIDPRISRRWLLRTCTGCKLPSTEAYYCVHGPLSTASSWPTLKPLAARWGKRAVASLTWPLMLTNTTVSVKRNAIKLR